MEDKRLYAVACFAFKPDPAQEVMRSDKNGLSTMAVCDGTNSRCDMTADFCSGYDFGEKEEVEKVALQWAKDTRWPESEGWKLHRVQLAEIPIAEILRAACLPVKLSDDAQGTQDEAWQEIING